MFKKEDVEKALQTTIMAILGLYKDADQVIDELNKIEDEELREIAKGHLAAGLTTRMLAMVTGTM